MKRIEHIGIAVQDLESAERIFEDILGEPAFKRESVPSELVNVSFFQTGESKVELLESTTPDGPIAKHIEKRGEGCITWRLPWMICMPKSNVYKKWGTAW